MRTKLLETFQEFSFLHFCLLSYDGNFFLSALNLYWLLPLQIRAVLLLAACQFLYSYSSKNVSNPNSPRFCFEVLFVGLQESTSKHKKALPQKCREPCKAILLSLGILVTTAPESCAKGKDKESSAFCKHSGILMYQMLCVCTYV